MITPKNNPKARRKAQGSTLSRFIDRLAVAFLGRYGQGNHPINRAIWARGLRVLGARIRAERDEQEKKEQARAEWNSIYESHQNRLKIERHKLKEQMDRERLQNSVYPHFRLMPLDDETSKSTQKKDEPPWTF